MSPDYWPANNCIKKNSRLTGKFCMMSWWTIRMAVYVSFPCVDTLPYHT